MRVKTLRQIPAILAIALGMGLISNTLRHNSLQMPGDWAFEARKTSTTGEYLIISLSEAAKLFTEKSMVIINARSEEDFRKGHIQGAKSLPWQDGDQWFIVFFIKLSNVSKRINYKPNRIFF